MTYQDLVFRQLESTSKGTVSQAIVRFENGLGLSVLRGPGTLTSADRPYEAAVIAFNPDVYPDFTHHDVLPFLTGEQVSEYMVKVSAGTQIAPLEA